MTDTPKTGADTGLPALNLLQFARIVKTGADVSGAQYIDLMRRVVPLDDLRNLTPEEGEWFAGAACWLNDYAILLMEFLDSERGGQMHVLGVPYLVGPSGPEVPHALVRGNDEPDFTFLETFGLERDE